MKLSTSGTRIAALAAGVSAMALLASGAAAQEYQFRMAHVVSPSEPMHIASEHMAERVAERSEGRISIEVFPSGQLGTNQELYEQVRAGAPVIQIADPGYLSDFVPDFGILNGPYLLDDPADFAKLTDSDWYQGIVADLAAEERIQVLSLGWLFGDRHIISDQEIRTPEDLDGVTIRVPPNVMWIETFEALGARGETLAWPEVYSGLASGVIDAAEAPLSSLHGDSLYESADTISMTGHFTAFIGPVMNSDLFNDMPEDLQQIMIEEAEAANAFIAEVVAEQEEELIAELEAEGVTFVHDVDREAMREATAGVYEAFPDWSDGLHDRVMGLLSE